MLAADGVVKLVDFGLSKWVDRSSELSLTRTGQVLGTPYYMSPEQIKGDPLDPRTDIYSLGATFYHLLTREVPFAGDSLVQVVHGHLYNARPDPRSLIPDLPAPVSAIIAKAMAVDLEDRYESITDFIVDLESISAEAPANARHDGKFQRVGQDH